MQKLNLDEARQIVGTKPTRRISKRHDALYASIADLAEGEILNISIKEEFPGKDRENAIANLRMIATRCSVRANLEGDNQFVVSSIRRGSDIVLVGHEHDLDQVKVSAARKRVRAAWITRSAKTERQSFFGKLLRGEPTRSAPEPVRKLPVRQEDTSSNGFSPTLVAVLIERYLRKASEEGSYLTNNEVQEAVAAGLGARYKEIF